MGYAKKRVGKGRRARYTAVYVDLRGRERSAGTFSNKKDADKAWQKAEVKLQEGRVHDLKRGQQTFERYVTEEWMPKHLVEPSTRQNSEYQINKHILPWFGPMKIADILPTDVRDWVLSLQELVHPKTGRKLLRPKTIRNLRNLLSSIFTTALNDQIIFLHPCTGVRTPTVGRKPLKVITSEQFDLIYQALPDADYQLLIETEIESGLRWGELSELRVKDLDFATRILTVSRAVVELNPKFHPEGKRFLVKEYPKDKEYRRFKLSPQIVDKLKAHVEAKNLEDDDLLFAIRDQQITKPRTRLTAVPDPNTLGMTEPNEKGKQYKHGTLSAYTAGRCRCQYCKAAFAIYRAKRRAAGKDKPRTPRVLDTDGHIPGEWFRRSIWNPARAKAELPFKVTIRDLRHAHASWLLAGGADLQVVKERLGHGSISTTERYLHTLPDADETALEAFDKIRKGKQTAAEEHQSALNELQAENEKLRAAIAKQAIALHLDQDKSRPA